jgi:hypothetical protein
MTADSNTRRKLSNETAGEPGVFYRIAQALCRGDDFLRKREPPCPQFVMEEFSPGGREEKRDFSLREPTRLREQT